MASFIKQCSSLRCSHFTLNVVLLCWIILAADVGRVVRANTARPRRRRQQQQQRSSTAAASSSLSHGRRGECLPIATDRSSFFCQPAPKADHNNDETTAVCQDDHAECANWAAHDECQRNPNYMLFQCPQSCNSCIDGHGGVTQVISDPARQLDIHAHVRATRHYLTAFYAARPDLDHHCRNADERCTYWAVMGECVANPGFMRTACAAACRTCG